VFENVRGMKLKKSFLSCLNNGFFFTHQSKSKEESRNRPKSRGGTASDNDESGPAVSSTYPFNRNDSLFIDMTVDRLSLVESVYMHKKTQRLALNQEKF
jgi:hypothetical protein